MEGADDAVVRFTVNTASLVASRGLFAIIKACSKKLNQAINSGHTSSKRLKKLNTHNQPLEKIKDTYLKEDLSTIKRELKKHGVDFAFMPCHEEKDKYQIFFKAKDHETIRYGIDASYKRIQAKRNKHLTKEELKNEQGKNQKKTKSKTYKRKPIKKSKVRGMPNLS